MKTFIAILLFAAGLTQAAEKTNHQFKFPGQIYTPELVLHFGEQLELTDEQKKFIHAEIDEAKVAAKSDQEGLAAETRKMARLVKKSVTGETEALAQMRRVVDLEAKLKLIQWRMIIRVKNQLTATQRERLADLAATFDPKKVGPSPAQRQRLEDKVAKVRKGMRELAELGVSPDEVSKMLNGLNALFRERKYAEAEKLLDQALKKLADPF